MLYLVLLKNNNKPLAKPDPNMLLYIDSGCFNAD